jgi:DNA-binding transcriptional ArsR family regulator
MKNIPDISHIAGIIGEPSRGTMLTELMGGSLTATELAARADVSASTASEHLAKLLAAGLVVFEPQGRQRVYRLAGPEVARVLESLAALSPVVSSHDGVGYGLVDLRYARSCYDHLAGKVGVAVTEALVANGVLGESLSSEEFQVTPQGERWFAALEIDVEQARRKRRAFARRCIDWSERRPHLAGSLGAALLDRLFEMQWLERVEGERIVVLTGAGARGLVALLDDATLEAVISADQYVTY